MLISDDATAASAADFVTTTSSLLLLLLLVGMCVSMRRVGTVGVSHLETREIYIRCRPGPDVPLFSTEEN